MPVHLDLSGKSQNDAGRKKELSAPMGPHDFDLLRTSVRKLMADYGPDYWAAQDKDRAFPEAFFKAAGQAGWFACMIPEELGGEGAGAGSASVIVEEINRAGGDAAVINAQMSICGTLVRYGDAEQKALLPAIARGELRCLTVAATEPDSGADMSDLQSIARRDGNGWRINAHKVMVSMAEHTQLIMVLVKTERGPTVFLFDREQAGDSLELQPIDMVANRMTTLFFIDNLWLPDSAAVGGVGRGLAALSEGFVVRRAMAAAECIGNARFMLDRSFAYARERQTFGRLIGQNQGVQYPLTMAHARVEAADLMRWDALRAAAVGADNASGQSAMAKLLASEAAWETSRAALTTFGGWALAAEYHMERKLRENTVFVFNNMLLSHLAQQVLGLPKAF